MESQLVSLYAERQQLHQALGFSDADEVIAAFEAVKAEAARAVAEAARSAESDRSPANWLVDLGDGEAVDGTSTHDGAGASSAADGGISVLELEARIAELDRWADELATKAEELDRRERSLHAAPAIDLSSTPELDDARLALERHAQEIDERDAKLAQR
ncbi:MAG: hypothetical protein AB7Q27_16065, partial [Acidimicrobiia bacterium]